MPRTSDPDCISVADGLNTGLRFSDDTLLRSRIRSHCVQRMAARENLHERSGVQVDSGWAVAVTSTVLKLCAGQANWFYSCCILGSLVGIIGEANSFLPILFHPLGLQLSSENSVDTRANQRREATTSFAGAEATTVRVQSTEAV